MAIELLPQPQGGAPVGLEDYNYQNTIQQAMHNLLDGKYILTEWYTDTEPEIAQGSIINHAGNLYIVNDANEAIAGAPADGRVYIKLTRSGDILNASFVTSNIGYSYNHVYNSWYHADGTQLIPYILNKYDSTYWNKFYFFDYRFMNDDDWSTIPLTPLNNLNNLIQDDSLDSLLLPAGVTYFDFSSPNYINSDNVAPTIRNRLSWINYEDVNCFFANRGISYLNVGYIQYSYAFGNEMQIALRFVPDFAYNVADNRWILDNRGLVSSDNDSIISYFYQSAGGCKLRLIVTDDAGNRFLIDSNEYASNLALQVAHSVFIKISKANDNVDMWINGVKQDGIGAGTKTKTGSISAINLDVKTYFVMGANAGSVYLYEYAQSKLYLQDMLFANTYGEDYLDNFDGTDDKPYYKKEWLTINKTNARIDNDGNAGFNNLFCETLHINSIDSGASLTKKVRIPLGSWNLTTTASVTLNLATTYLSGIVNNKIRSCSVFITQDGAFPGIFPINHSSANLGYFSFDWTCSLVITRTGFSGTSWDDTTINRGYAEIEYYI